MQHQPKWLQSLKNPIFARLYLAQTINLVGDSLTWLGLALLAFELGGEQAGTILAGALTLRVTAFVVLSPIAGAIADRIDRKKLMIITHLLRMVIVCLLPWATQVWHIYAIVLSLNVFYAFFAPTYTATIPLVTQVEERSQAIALSSATYQLLSVIGPSIAGTIAAFVGMRQIFWLDGVTFLIAAILIAQLPGALLANQPARTTRTLNQMRQDIRTGTLCLILDPPIRYALLLQLVAAIAGAEILVNTVGYVQGTLHLGKVEYGWVMSVFGIGATLTSVWLGYAQQKINPVWLTSSGATLMTMVLLPANHVDLRELFLLWGIAGIGQTLVNVPTQTLIAERVAVEVQGRVYGTHFALSHLWWGLSYPLAGWLVSAFPNHNFFYSSLLGFILLTIVAIALKPGNLASSDRGLWHEHFHTHDEHHAHSHISNTVMQNPHHHLHFHNFLQQELDHSHH